jgi:hypothetical protein
LGIPKGGILCAVPIVDVHEAKVGSGTITPYLGPVATGKAFTAITTAGGLVDDGGGNDIIAGLRIDSAANGQINISVASNTVTAGGFTIWMPFFLGIDY